MFGQMSEAREYLSHFLSFWLPLVISGAFFGLDEALKRWFPETAEKMLGKIAPDVRRRIEIALLFLATFYAGFQAWDEEHLKYIDEHDKRIKAEALIPTGSLPPQISYMRNPNALYQYGEIFGEVQGAYTSLSSGTIEFKVVWINRYANPEQEIEYQDWRLSCPSLPKDSPNAVRGGVSGLIAGLTCSIKGKRN